MDLDLNHLLNKLKKKKIINHLVGDPVVRV
jgi:hypothetical protein